MRKVCRKFAQTSVAYLYSVILYLVGFLETELWLFIKLIVSTIILFFKRFYKKTAAFVLRAVAKHSPELAQVSHFQFLESLVQFLYFHILSTIFLFAHFKFATYFFAVEYDKSVMFKNNPFRTEVFII